VVLVFHSASLLRILPQEGAAPHTIQADAGGTRPCCGPKAGTGHRGAKSGGGSGWQAGFEEASTPAGPGQHQQRRRSSTHQQRHPGARVTRNLWWVPGALRITRRAQRKSAVGGSKRQLKRSSTKEWRSKQQSRWGAGSRARKIVKQSSCTERASHTALENNPRRHHARAWYCPCTSSSHALRRVRFDVTP
jgi:hypothetical protein